MDNSKFKIQNLDFFLSEAKKGGYAIGHFNFATADVLKAIVAGAKEAGASAVMVGTSEGEANFLGINEAVALVKAMREETGYPIFINADHFKSFDKCKEAIDAGYDSIIIDASKLPFDENISLTKQVVGYAHAISSDISVEGELGYLKGSSEVQSKIEISPADYTKPEEAQRFVAETGVDRMAVVFGNIHGIVTDQIEKLDLDHFAKIANILPVMPFVLHGASGLKDEDIQAAIKAGIVNVHFNTELRVAYKEGIEEALNQNPSETTPYKYLLPADQKVKELVMAKTRLFTSQ